MKRRLAEIPSLELETIDLADLVRLVVTARPPIHGLFCFEDGGAYYLSTLLRLHSDSNTLVSVKYRAGGKPTYSHISYKLSTSVGEVIEFRLREEITALNVPVLFLNAKPKLPPSNPRFLDVVEMEMADLPSFARLAVGQPFSLEEEYRRPTLLWWSREANKLLFPIMLYDREVRETMWVASLLAKEAAAYPFLRYSIENGKEHAELVKVPSDPHSFYGSIIHVERFPLGRTRQRPRV